MHIMTKVGSFDVKPTIDNGQMNRCIWNWNYWTLDLAEVQVKNLGSISRTFVMG